MVVTGRGVRRRAIRKDHIHAQAGDAVFCRLRHAQVEFRVKAEL